MFSTLLQLCHLTIVILVIISSFILKLLVQTLYNLFPWKNAIDSLYFKHPFLRAIFSYKLNSATPSSSSSAATTAPEMIRAEGFDCEEHIVHTPDGYILVLHRIVAPTMDALTRTLSHHSTSSRLRTLESTLNLEISQQERVRGDMLKSNNNQTTTQPISPPLPISHCSSSTTTTPPVVLCIHGLMMSSDSFVVSGAESLGFVLSQAPFDVWLGNLRGNRYTSHDRLSPQTDAYWNFSLDEFARYDVPSMIQYIIKHTKKERVSLVGFSQGSASTFAALVSVPDLQSSVACFAALAPATAIKGISHEGFASLLRVDPSFLYLVFGRKSFLSLVLDIQQILSAKAFVTVMDASMHFLFGWTSSHMVNKERLYTALVGLTSVQNVVHWMEIVRSNVFSTKQRHGQNNSTHFVAVNYDIKRIAPPLSLFFGTHDTLIDVPRLVRSLPPFSRPERVKNASSGEVLFQKQSGGPLIVCRVNGANAAAHDATEESDEEGGDEQLTRGSASMLHRSATTSSLIAPLLRQKDETPSASNHRLVEYERHPLLLFEVPGIEHLDVLWGTKKDLVFPALVQFLKKHST